MGNQKTGILSSVSDDALRRYIAQKKKDDMILRAAASDVFRKINKNGSKNKTPHKLARKLNRHAHVNRNEPCTCGSGKKFKYCCMGVKNG